MITEEEKKEIIDLAVEKTLLLIPETIGNLMTEHASLAKINHKFYNDHPELKDKKDVVASVIEMVEGRNPLAEYEDILKEALPEIRQRIKTVKALDITTVSPAPDRSFKTIDIPKVDKVDPHGEV